MLDKTISRRINFVPGLMDTKISPEISPYGGLIMIIFILPVVTDHCYNDLLISIMACVTVIACHGRFSANLLVDSLRKYAFYKLKWYPFTRLSISRIAIICLIVAALN